MISVSINSDIVLFMVALSPQEIKLVERIHINITNLKKIFIILIR